MPVDVYAKLLAKIELMNDEIFQTEKQLKWMKADWREAKPRLEALINNRILSEERRQEAERLKNLGEDHIRLMQAQVFLLRQVSEGIEEYYNQKTDGLYGESPMICKS